jgi:four helix bundle protein
MPTINTFEELEVWKNAQEIAKRIFILCESNAKLAKDFSMKDQIKRAVLSISNNIAEGFEYSNNNQFIRYLSIAKGSCGEVRNCLHFLISVEYANENEVNTLILSTRKISGQIGKLIKYLRTVKASNPQLSNPQPPNI